MIKLKGISLPEFPFLNHKKVADIFYYEGPILSHFKGENDSDFFYYWIDRDEKLNRWLIFPLEEHRIIEYLNGYVSLRDLIYNFKNNFIFTVDIDRDLNYSNAIMINPFQLPSNYLPEEESFYTASAVPQYYQKRFKQINSFNYESILKEHALYVMIKSRKKGEKSLVEAEYAADVIYDLAKSCKEYAYYDFYNNFKSKYHNPQNLATAALDMKKQVSPLIVANRISSFCLGISNDFILSQSDLEIRTWEKKFIKNFRADVIEVDFSSKEDQDRIKNKFTVDQRVKIYEPYFKILNNETYGLWITDKNFESPISRPKIAEENKMKLILPPVHKKTYLEVSEEKEIHNITIEVPKGQDISKLSGKKLLAVTLFDKIIDEFEGELVEINYQGHKILFKEPTKYSVTLEGNIYTLYFEPLEIAVSGKNKAQYLSRFYEKLIDVLENPQTLPGIYKTLKSLIESRSKD